MYKVILTLAVFIAVTSSSVSAEIPTYPGAKAIAPAQPQPGANIKIDMPGMPGIKGIDSTSKSQSFSVPSTTKFEEVKKFYTEALTKQGYTEKASINAGGVETASYSSSNGMDTVTVTLAKNFANPAESLLSVSESSTKMN